MSKIFLLVVVLSLNMFTFYFAPSMKEPLVLIDLCFFIVIFSMILVSGEKNDL